MRNKTRIYCIPLFWVKKRWRSGMFKMIFSFQAKLKSQVQQNYLSKKVAEWSPNNFLNIILRGPLIVKCREIFEWNLKILTDRNFIFKKRITKYQCRKKSTIIIITSTTVIPVWELAVSHWSYQLVK